MSVLLGINIDHVATLRQARGTRYPDPVQAALIAEQAGADGITVHLREDRRHIQDRDVELLAHTLQTRMNLEMAATEEMVGIARRIGPAHSCLVPEKREELTTEGGLDVVANEDWIRDCCTRLADAGIEVSLFIDAVALGREAGLIVNAGHGLHYHNTREIAAIPGINELNIGHGIIARAVMTGLDEAVRAMRALIDGAV